MILIRTDHPYLRVRYYNLCHGLSLKKMNQRLCEQEV
jgi:hypothetical protein